VKDVLEHFVIDVMELERIWRSDEIVQWLLPMNTTTGAEALIGCDAFAALKRRSSTGVQASGGKPKVLANTEALDRLWR
jgi:hypothetical protein